MRLIGLCVIDTGEPIVKIIADEVAGGRGQRNVGQRSRSPANAEGTHMISQQRRNREQQ